MFINSTGEVMFWIRTSMILYMVLLMVVFSAASVLSGKFALLIWDGFSLTVRRATQEGRASFKVAQQSCRRKDAQSSGGNFPDSALVRVQLTKQAHSELTRPSPQGGSRLSLLCALLPLNQVPNHTDSFASTRGSRSEEESPIQPGGLTALRLEGA